MHTNSRKSWGIEKYPRFEKQTRGFQKRETFPKLKPLKTAVEHMFPPVYLHKVLCFLLFLITKT